MLSYSVAKPFGKHLIILTHLKYCKLVKGGDEMLSKVINLLTVLAMGDLILAQKSFAYLDPGTGSYILQVLAAVIFSSLFTIKIYWKKIKKFFSRRKKKSVDDGS